jgi:hypothetical protein
MLPREQLRGVVEAPEEPHTPRPGILRFQSLGGLHEVRTCSKKPITSSRASHVSGSSRALQQQLHLHRHVFRGEVHKVLHQAQPHHVGMMLVKGGDVSHAASRQEIRRKDKELGVCVFITAVPLHTNQGSVQYPTVSKHATYTYKNKQLLKIHH